MARTTLRRAPTFRQTAKARGIAIPGAVRESAEGETRALPGSKKRAGRRASRRSSRRVRPAASDGAYEPAPRRAPTTRRRRSALSKAGARVQAHVEREVAAVVKKRGAAAVKKAAEKYAALGSRAKGALKGAGVAAAGLAAYELTRRSKLGGAGGDYVVKKIFERREKDEATRMAAFRAELAAARADHKVSGAEVKAIARKYGFTG